jgi:hypothetical protein
VVHTRKPVPPASARCKSVVALTVAGLVVVALAIVGGRLLPAMAGRGLIAVAFTTAAWVLMFRSRGWQLVLHGERFLTVWTLTGRRSVDLHRLAKVDRFLVTSKRNGLDLLVLTDTSGIDIEINSPEVDRAVVDALTRQENGQPSVSLSARHRLGLLDVPLADQLASSGNVFAKFGLSAAVALVVVFTVSMMAERL